VLLIDSKRSWAAWQMLYKAISIADHDECGLAVDAIKADLTAALAHLCHASVAQSTILSLMTTHCISISGQKLCMLPYDASYVMTHRWCGL